MSEEAQNGKGATDTLSENPGFRTALLINVPNYNAENGLKEVTEGLEGMKMNSSDFFITPTITPRQSDTYKNCISSDLLKRLEESSPIKTHLSNEFVRKPSDICLLNCDKDEADQDLIAPITKEEGLKLKENKKEEVVKELDKTDETEGKKGNQEKNLTENVISNMSTNPLRTRNFKLKTQICNNKVEINEEENQETFDNGSKRMSNTNAKNISEEPQSLFSNSMNFSNFTGMNSQTYYSPPYTTKQAKHSRKESPILTYYDGTTEFISQTMFFDEFKKNNNEKVMSKHNYIKKVEEVPLSEEENLSNSIHNMNNMSSMNSMYSPTITQSKSSLNFHSSKVTDDQSSFNSFQLPYNFFNNNSSSNPNFININNLNQNFNQNPFARGNNTNQQSNLDYSLNNSSDHFNMMNMNQMNNDVNMSMMSNGQMNYTPVKRNNMKNVTAPNQQTQMHSQIDSPDEYTVEMFGRKGWICEMCNNFNYETRQKCNRCGINKSPKRIKKHSQTLKMNPDMRMSQDDGDEYDESGEKRKKKPFVERVGDWVCIKCKNLNFSFRVVCNRCQLPKSESEKMFEHYMSNLMNYVKFNEIMQQNILLGQNQVPQPMPTQNQIPSYTQGSGFVNNNSININNNYYNNYNQPKTSSNYGFSGKVQPPFNSNSNGVSYLSSSMSMSNVSNPGSMSMGGNQFPMGNVGEDEYYDDEN